MKRIKMKISPFLKTAMLCFALLGGTYGAALATGNSAKALKYGFTFSIVGAMKKRKVDLDEAEEKLLKEVDKELNEQLKSWLDENSDDGFITKSNFEKFMKEKAGDILAALPVKDAKIGEGDKAKTIESILREMGQDVTKALNGGGSKAQKKTFDEMLAEKLKSPEFENMLKAKNGHVTLSLKAVDIMTTATVVDDTDIPEDLVESFSIGAFVPKRRPREYVFDIASRTTVAKVEQFKTWLEEGDNQGAFAIVEEGAVKPLMDLALVRNHSEYRKAAGKYVITEEVQKFRANALNIIRGLINDKVLREYADILAVDLLAAAASYTGTALDGTIANANDYDAIGAVCAQIESLDFMPDVLILNPQDKWRLALQKGTDGHYFVNIPVYTPDGQVRIMGLLVRTSNKITAGRAIIGEGGLWKIEDEAITIRMGYGLTMNGATAESDFDHNRMRVIAETFFHDYIATNHLGSFVEFGFDEVKELIELDEVVNP